ncbi:citrate synthase, mitochondrial [Filimonas sp.]|nr:citrate synthase, mitochondrial [Filimonas sp.]
MGKLKEHFYQTAIKAADEIKQIVKEHGDTVVDTVTLSQVYQGMRGIVGLVTETSLLDANEGIRFRGFSIPELIEKLPHVEGGSQPCRKACFI